MCNHVWRKYDICIFFRRRTAPGPGSAPASRPRQVGVTGTVSGPPMRVPQICGIRPESDPGWRGPAPRPPAGRVTKPAHWWRPGESPGPGLAEALSRGPDHRDCQCAGPGGSAGLIMIGNLNQSHRGQPRPDDSPAPMTVRRVRRLG